MDNKKLNNIGILVGVAGIGYAMFITRKMNKLCEKIDTTVDGISKDINVDIPNNVIEQAVEKAVDREVSNAVEYVSHKAVREIKKDIHDQVKASVDEAYSNVKDSVTRKISEEVANIDVHRLSKDVTAKAEQKIIDKFDDNLDELLDKFNHELTSVSKIYKSIQDTMSRNNEKETILKISN